MLNRSGLRWMTLEGELILNAEEQASTAQQQAVAAQQRAEQLAQRLRELGINPDEVV